ncbi:hypothetical protein D9758_001632 [Tetrapyrgos nigripes]|uniref:F-box domain-containing protein n=1 Tax=Tetrapyrgos nigripes TaxID=182062 RepID=A0A8H5LXP2_9AGAR|nr:hypothetical protein D9758_001632 [Tetrapyrgos nigripes]
MSSNTFLPPIQRLPPELLQCIFPLCCDLLLPTEFHTISKRREIEDVRSPSFIHLSALALSHVCTRWRDISLSDSDLWSRVEIRGWLEDLTTNKVSSIASLTALYLERSKQRHLAIVVEFYDSFFGSKGDSDLIHLSDGLYEKARSFLPVYKLLFYEARRWRNVHICVHRTLSLSQPFLWPKRFPVLRHLSIHIMGNFFDSLGFITDLQLLEAPLLETLVHTGHNMLFAPYPDESEYWPLPSLQRALFTGAVSPNVKIAGPTTDLTLRHIDGAMAMQLDYTPCLPKKLYILTPPETYPYTTLSTTFDELTFPNLVELFIESSPLYIHEPNFPVNDSFIPFLDRSRSLSNKQSLITHLSLINVSIPDHELLSILALLPLVSHFAIGDVYYHTRAKNDEGEDEEDHAERLSEMDEDSTMLSQSFFHALSSYDPGITLGLRELHVGFGRFNNTKRAAVLDFLNFSHRRRAQSNGGGGMLQYVRVKIPDDWRDDHMLEQVGWQAEGQEDRIIIDIDWISSSMEWRSGLGSWRVVDS